MAYYSTHGISQFLLNNEKQSVRFLLSHPVHCTTGGLQKVLSLAVFPYFFGLWNVTDFSNRYLLVFSKNFKSSACLFYEITFIAFSWLHIISNFNEIRYHSDRIFDAEERSVADDTQLNDCCLWWRCAIVCHRQMMGCVVLLRQNNPWKCVYYARPKRLVIILKIFIHHTMVAYIIALRLNQVHFPIIRSFTCGRLYWNKPWSWAPCQDAHH